MPVSATSIAQAAITLGASQRAGELAQALELAAEIQPQVIVEIGCDRGGTLYAWRQICERVYGITLADNSPATGGAGGRLVPHGATVLAGDSHDPASLAWLTGRLSGHPVDVLVIDGDHSVAGVRADLAMYGPLVHPGGLILLHDVVHTADPRAEVWKLWPELADRYEHSVISESTGITWVCFGDRLAESAGGFGWGVIRIRPGDRFGEQAEAST